MDAQNVDKAQMFTDTVQSHGNWLLRCWVWSPGKELSGATLCLGCALPLSGLTAEQNDTIFTFHIFL